MKQSTLLGISGIALGFVLLGTQSIEAASLLKCGVYNIHHGEGTDGVYDLSRIATLLQSTVPDIVGLNEVYRRNPAYGLDLQDQEIAKALGTEWTAVFGKTLERSGFIEFGNAVVTRLPVVSSQSYLFSPTEGLERRGMLRVTVEKDNRQIHFFVTHLGLNVQERNRHANEILTILSDYTDGVVILAGDFNEQSGGSTLKIVKNALVDTFERYGLGEGKTFGNPTLTARIDFIFVENEMDCSSVYVPQSDLAAVASDHRPVFTLLDDPTLSSTQRNFLEAEVENQIVLEAEDTVPNDPNAFTQGSFVIVTNGNGTTCSLRLDNLVVEEPVTVYKENFEFYRDGEVPSDWTQLYVTDGGTALGECQRIGGTTFWHQKSDKYAKYLYAPEPYPTWTDGKCTARIKTLRFGNGAWRLNWFNPTATNTAYNTYKIEVRDLSGALPVLRLMKGGEKLGEVTLSSLGIDPCDWHVYSIETERIPESASTHRNRVSIWIDGLRCLQAEDTVDSTQESFTHGSMVMVTVGGTAGDCEILVDDVAVQKWRESYSENFNALEAGSLPTDWSLLYTSAGGSYVAAVGDGLESAGWTQHSDSYEKVHYAPNPYPKWSSVRLAADIQSPDLGDGQWRLNLYNYPETNTAYDTYKLEMNQSSEDTQLRLRKGTAVLSAVSTSDLQLDPAEWNHYRFRIQSHRMQTRIIDKLMPRSFSSWVLY